MADEKIDETKPPPSSFQRDALILMTTKWLAAEAELSHIKQASAKTDGPLAAYVGLGTALGFIAGAVLGILVGR